MDELQVVSGHEADGTDWSVTAGPDGTEEESFWTFVSRSRPGGRPARSGMGGPKLHDGNLVNVWAGRADGTPPFVMLRAAPEVTRVTVTTSVGHDLQMTMSEVVEEFGLRFGAVALADEDEPLVLSVEHADGRTVTGPVPWPRRRRPRAPKCPSPKQDRRPWVGALAGPPPTEASAGRCVGGLVVVASDLGGGEPQ